MNIVILTGRLTKTPELKKTATGSTVLSFSLAVDRGDKARTTDEYKTTTDRAPEPEPTPEPTAPAVFICEDCGNTITAKGKASAENIAASSRVKFGRQLCYNCGHEEKLRREALPFPIDEGGIE